MPSTPLPKEVLPGSILTARGGRLRLGWRLLFFLVVVGVVEMIVTTLLPAGIQYASAALLLGALAGGWAMLALDGRAPGALGFYLRPVAGREAAVGLGLGVRDAALPSR